MTGKVRYRDGRIGEIETTINIINVRLKELMLWNFFLQLLVNGVCVGLLYGISAMGFVMIFKSSSVLNFAHGELLALGAFFFLSLVTWAKLPIIVAFILTLVGCFILGFLIERFFLRPLIGEKLIFVIMLTVGLAAMFKGLILLIWGGNLHTYPEFLPPTMGLQFGVHLYRAGLFGHTDYQRYFSGSVRLVFQKISAGNLYALCRR